ncbi:zinc finger protein Xfin-like [Eleutherodactylus coqui]|uniref:zinc finger protein Xfin-like n=1 Tax=Eleutherodactylus coqui TaxID=57060 RepID=UPI00346259DC
MSLDAHENFSSMDLIRATCTIQSQDNEQTQRIGQELAKCYDSRESNKLLSNSGIKRFSSRIQNSEIEKNFSKRTHCSKVFNDCSLLAEHEKPHTEKKTFTCPDCGKAFIRKSILKLHQRTHTGERPYACTDCGKRFSQRFNLVIHQRIHTGEKPHKCPTCNKSFRYKPALVRHEKDGQCLKNLSKTQTVVKEKSPAPLLWTAASANALHVDLWSPINHSSSSLNSMHDTVDSKFQKCISMSSPEDENCNVQGVKDPSTPPSSLHLVSSTDPLTSRSTISHDLRIKPPSSLTYDQSSIKTLLDTLPSMCPPFGKKNPLASPSSIYKFSGRKYPTASPSSISHSFNTKGSSASPSSISCSTDTKPPLVSPPFSHSLDFKPSASSSSLIPQSSCINPLYASSFTTSSPSDKKLTLASRSSKCNAPTVKLLSTTSSYTIYQSIKSPSSPSFTSSQKQDMKLSSTLSLAGYHPSGVKSNSSSMISCPQSSHMKHVSSNYDSPGGKCSSLLNSTSHLPFVKKPPSKPSLPLSSTSHLSDAKPSESPTSICRQTTSFPAPSDASPHRPVEKPFKCSQCKKAFIHLSQLTDHQVSHTGSQNTCLECNKSFIRKSTLILHKRTHTGERPFACTECGRRFSQRFNLVVHQRIHTGENPYVCTECHKSFRYRTGLLRHQRHGPCTKKPPTENSPTDNLNSPQSTPTIDRYLKFPSASLESRKGSSFEHPDLTNHLRRELPMEKWQGIKYKTACSPLASLGGQSKSKRAPFSISEKLSAIGSTRSASYKVNVKLKPLKADEPSKGTNTLYSTLRSSVEPSFASHNPKFLKQSSVNIISPYSPPIVNQVPKSSTCVLDNRASINHRPRMEKRQYKCDHCKKCFSQLNEYVEHQTMHNSSRHGCTLCSKVFSKASQLVLHQRTHTGEKPYTCGKCDKQFSQKFNLVVHQRIHTGEKPFICVNCNKAFRYRTGLLKHQKYNLCS